MYKIEMSNLNEFEDSFVHLITTKFMK